MGILPLVNSYMFVRFHSSYISGDVWDKAMSAVTTSSGSNLVLLTNNNVLVEYSIDSICTDLRQSIPLSYSVICLCKCITRFVI